MCTLLQVPLFGAVLLIALAGCQMAPAGPVTAPPPVPADGADRISAAELATGRALYINKCARCHKFYDPAKYNDAEWNKWMTKMGRKARLQPDERQLLDRYLGAYRVTTN